MAETRPGEDIEQRLEHDADEFDERLQRLDDHIDEARDKARDRAEDAAEPEAVGGDWQGSGEASGPGPQFGEDPEGAAKAAAIEDERREGGDN